MHNILLECEHIDQFPEYSGQLLTRKCRGESVSNKKLRLKYRKEYLGHLMRYNKYRLQQLILQRSEFHKRSREKKKLMNAKSTQVV